MGSCPRSNGARQPAEFACSEGTPHRFRGLVRCARADAVRYQLYRVSRSRRRTAEGASIAIEGWAAIVAGLDALGLDGHQLVLGNNRHDLPPDGGFYEATLSAEVVSQQHATLSAVTAAALLAAVTEPPASLATSFEALLRLYADAAQRQLDLDVAPGE